MMARLLVKIALGLIISLKLSSFIVMADETTKETEHSIKNFHFSIYTNPVGYFFEDYNAIVNIRLADFLWLGAENLYRIDRHKDSGIRYTSNYFKTLFTFEPFQDGFGILQFVLSCGLTESTSELGQGKTSSSYYNLELMLGYSIINLNGYSTLFSIGIGHRELIDSHSVLFWKNGGYYFLYPAYATEKYLAITGGIGWSF